MIFKEGRNELLAIGFANGKAVARDSIVVQYSYEKNGNPVALKLSSQPLANGNLLIEARAIDAQGRLCLDFNRRVYFDYSGDGVLLKDYGTPTRSSVIEFANGGAAIEFAPAKNGKTVIEARTHDLQGSYLVIEQ